MADTASVTIIDGSDWAGLYVNDKLVRQGHRIDPEHVLEAITGMTLTEYDMHEADPVWLENSGEFPYELHDARYRV